jgi:geranylgeranyl pyrophosphate synthase
MPAARAQPNPRPARKPSRKENESLESPTPSLPLIQDQVRKELSLVRKTIEKLLVPEILDAETEEKLLKYADDDSIRPSVFLLTALASGGIRDADIPIVAGCEFFHLATWVHDAAIDDLVIDGWPRERMVVDGDHIFSTGLTLLTVGSERAGEIASGMIASMALGEIQYVREGLDSSVEEHLDMLGRKHGSLFGASCELAALRSNLDQSHSENLHEYGLDLGVAHALGNEILYFPQIVRRRRISLALLCADDGKGRKTRMVEERDVDALTQLCASSGGFETTRKTVDTFAGKAHDALRASGIESEPLENLCAWVRERTRR